MVLRSLGTVSVCRRRARGRAPWRQSPCFPGSVASISDGGAAGGPPRALAASPSPPLRRQRRRHVRHGRTAVVAGAARGGHPRPCPARPWPRCGTATKPSSAPTAGVLPGAAMARHRRPARVRVRPWPCWPSRATSRATRPHLSLLRPKSSPARWGAARRPIRRPATWPSTTASVFPVHSRT